MKSTKMRKKHRNAKGSLLVICALLLFVLVALLAFFMLDFVRFLGSHQEQVTAIEAAALAAAQDISQIVVEDPNYGFVGLSDSAPVGKITKAADGYYLPVRSINTILATVRLDMIIADKLNDNIMRQFVRRDYDTARAAAARLTAQLKSAIGPSGTGTDKDGNILNPLEDAVAAYKANQVRIARGQSTLVPTSMELTLGVVDPVPSITSIPQPANFAEVAANQQDHEFYKAFVNVPYSGYDFVFAGVGKSAILVDGKHFAESRGNLPFFIPSIVKCEADQRFASDSGTRTVHACAWAEPGVGEDKRPAPGAFSITLPTGNVTELNSLVSIVTNTEISKAPADETVTARGSDAPPAALSLTQLPILNNPRPPFGQLLRVALYDWIKRNGPNLNVKSFLDGFCSNFPAAGGPTRVMIESDVRGIVKLRAEPLGISDALVVGNNQWAAVSGLIFKDSTKSEYDCYLKDYVFQAGRTSGGIHAGEPLGPPTAGPACQKDPLSTSLSEKSPQTIAFPVGSGEVRPTYTRPGIAVDLKIVKRTP